jgi:hypothetical protein
MFIQSCWQLTGFVALVLQCTASGTHQLTQQGFNRPCCVLEQHDLVVLSSWPLVWVVLLSRSLVTRLFSLCIFFCVDACLERSS